MTTPRLRQHEGLGDIHVLARQQRIRVGARRELGAGLLAGDVLGELLRKASERAREKKPMVRLTSTLGGVGF